MRIRVDLAENGWAVAGERFDKVLVNNYHLDEYLAMKDIQVEVGQYTMVDGVDSISSDGKLCVIRT